MREVMDGGYCYVSLITALVIVLVFVLALIAVCSTKGWRRRAAAKVLQQILDAVRRPGDRDDSRRSQTVSRRRAECGEYRPVRRRRP